MKKTSKERYAFLMEMLEKFTTTYDALVDDIHNEGDIKEMADLTYVLRLFDDVVHDMHKRTAATKDLSDRLLCLMWAKTGSSEPIRTEYCTITPRIKMAANVPKKGSPEYKALMLSLGVSNPEVLECEALRPHWPGLTDYITARLTEGKPVPGVDMSSTYPVYGTTLLKKKGVTE
jgi:hypothetical protein